MARLFEATPANDLPDVPNYNVCPTTNVPVVTSESGQRQYRSMRWGFIPHWYKKANGGPLLINARSETIAEKPAFRAACRERRCLVVATGFYEWHRSDGQQPLPWWVTPADGGPLVMAGIWQRWEQNETSLSTVAIVTADANEDMAPIHHRLPVILPAESWALWLGEAGKGAAVLMKNAPNGALHFQRVGTAVNSNRATGPELIEPID